MIAILVLSVVFFYAIAFRDLSPRQMELTAVLLLLTAGPLMALAIKICLPYRR